jgi:hypothetical protein
VDHVGKLLLARLEVARHSKDGDVSWRSTVDLDETAAARRPAAPLVGVMTPDEPRAVKETRAGTDHPEAGRQVMSSVDSGDRHKSTIDNTGTGKATYAYEEPSSSHVEVGRAAAACD